MEEEKTWLSDRYLDELPAIDKDQRDYILKKSKDHDFLSEAQALRFWHVAVDVALKRIGLPKQWIMAAKSREEKERIAARFMRKRQIRIENRRFTNRDETDLIHGVEVLGPEHTNLSGTYIYKRDELCYFVGFPWRVPTMKHNPKNVGKYVVKTNVPVEVQ